MTENKELIIDWELATKLAGNKRDLAEEMLSIMVKSLPYELETIKIALATHDIATLAKLLHKFRGGLSYCGLPRLKNAATAFETAVKTNQLSTLAKHYSDLEEEMLLVLQLNDQTAK